MAASSRRQVAEGIRRSLFLVSALTLTTAIAVAEVRVMHEQQVLPLDPVAEIHATAIDENVIVLGAPEDASLGPESGAVYVFERPEGGDWAQAAWLRDRDGALCHRFGRAVDVEGGTLVTNHLNWVYECDPAGARPDREDGVQAFERSDAGWVQTFGRHKFLSQGTDLAFDGTSWAHALDMSGAYVFTRQPDGSWSEPIQLPSTGNLYSDDESPGLHLDMHNGLLVLGARHEARDGDEEFLLPAASLYQRRPDGTWQQLPDVKVPLTPARRFDHSLYTRVASGPRQRIAINEVVFERLGFPEYTESVSLRPACAPADANVDIQFDEQSALALVRTRPAFHRRSLHARGNTLHLHDRISLGNWKLVAQLIPSDNSPANVTSPGDYEESFAIDSRTIVSNHRVWSADAPTVSYVFSKLDPCLGHRGNWVELNPERWEINTYNGPHYRIRTTDYTNQSGDRPGEYSLISMHRHGDFDFSMKARSDEKLGEYSAADYVVIFGYQDDDNYYYMMFNRYRDNNELFKVVDGVRQVLARAPRASFLDNEFHRVEISRRGERIRVRFDGRDYLTVMDDTFGVGAIGIGSYNDAASFDDVMVVKLSP
jgi:hypothetical protein